MQILISTAVAAVQLALFDWGGGVPDENVTVSVLWFQFSGHAVPKEQQLLLAVTENIALFSVLLFNLHLDIPIFTSELS